MQADSTRPIWVSETSFQHTVLDLARLRGWKVCHFRPGLDRRGRWSTPMQGDPGFPDLVMTRKGRLIFAELKSDKGKPAPPAQEEWLAALRETAAGFYEWRPADWENIMEILK